MKFVTNYSRKCPICERDIIYKTISQYYDAVKKQRRCKSCSNKYRITKSTKNNIKYSKVCIICGTTHTFSTYTKYNNAKSSESYICKTCATKKRHTGKIISEEHRRIISICVSNNWKNHCYDHLRLEWSEKWSGEKNPMYNSNRYGELNPFYKKQHTAENIEKMRYIAHNISPETRKQMQLSGKLRVIKYGTPLSYNPKSIPIIEQYGKEHGYNFQHAENGGEIMVRVGNNCYYLDGYDAENNVVIEYYEPHHKRYIDRDLIRKNNIMHKLLCEFIEIKEWEL